MESFDERRVPDHQRPHRTGTVECLCFSIRRSSISMIDVCDWLKSDKNGAILKTASRSRLFISDRTVNHLHRLSDIRRCREQTASCVSDGHGHHDVNIVDSHTTEPFLRDNKTKVVANILKRTAYRKKSHSLTSNRHIYSDTTRRHLAYQSAISNVKRLLNFFEVSICGTTKAVATLMTWVAVYQLYKHGFLWNGTWWSQYECHCTKSTKNFHTRSEHSAGRTEKTEIEPFTQRGIA